jgi:hypothetical protein
MFIILFFITLLILFGSIIFIHYKIGKNYIIILFILLLGIVLIFILRINLINCDVKKNNITNCFETFTTPSGILYNTKNEWCNKIGNYCVNNDSITRLTKNEQLLDVGPCVTSTNQWGVIIPQYGRKCISINKKSNNEKSNNINANNLNINKVTTTNFDKLKQQKKIILSIDKKYTECKPIRSNFDYWCQAKYGRNYGYKNIIRGICDDNNMARAECDSTSYDGINLYKNSTNCLPNNNYYKHIDECKKLYTNSNIVGVKNISGYNCNPGYYRSICIKKNI